MNDRINVKNLIFLACVLTAFNAEAAPQDALNLYQQQGAEAADVQLGEKLWNTNFGDRSCSSCHGKDLKAMGAHEKTKKPIKPMALSVNAERYQKTKKIEKWFLRNCKWTFGRECNAQEETNLLSWLISQ